MGSRAVSERKWTPGPWTYRYHPPSEWSSEPTPDQLVGPDGESIRFANVTLTMSRDDEAVANTHLIAAAPALLDACEALIRYDTDADMSDVQMMVDYADAIAKAKAAVALAREPSNPGEKS